MILAAPALILPPEKPALVRAADMRGLPSWAEMKRREKVVREATFPFPLFVQPFWQTVATATLSGGDIGASWATYTIRQFIDQASLTITGGSKIRITIQAPGANGFGWDQFYIGQASAGYTTTAPAYAATPTQVTFGGSGSGTLASGASDLVSDQINFTVPSANGLIIAWHLTAGAGNGSMPAHATLPTNWTTSQLVTTSDAATVAATGYTNATGLAHAFLVKKLEVFR